MKTILHMSTTVDGFIARADGNSDWVSKIDCDLFEQRYKEIGCVVVGTRTFDQFQGSLYPMPGITTIVLTSDASRSSDNPLISFANSPQEALTIAKTKGFDSVLLAGGGRTNASFLNEGLIDEVFLSVHPFNLNQGIKLFEGTTKENHFTLVGVREMGEGLVELNYKK